MVKIEVLSFRTQIKRTQRKVFLGYARLRVAIAGLSFQLQHVEVSVLRGEAGNVNRLDFHSLRGTDGNFYPTFFPETPELRKLMTEQVFSDPQIVEFRDAVITTTEEEARANN